MRAEPDRRFFRVVIGCYSHTAGLWSARKDLRAFGLQNHQICSLGSRSALALDENDSSPGVRTDEADSWAILYSPRHVRDLELHVSSASLFDGLWPAPYDHNGSLAQWMTFTQSDIIWRKLCDHCPLLIVSAESTQQQIRSVKIQLQHGPAVVQAYNFAI
jgi:hypothetical protein